MVLRISRRLEMRSELGKKENTSLLRGQGMRGQEVRRLPPAPKHYKALSSLSAPSSSVEKKFVPWAPDVPD